MKLKVRLVLKAMVEGLERRVEVVELVLKSNVDKSVLKMIVD